MVICILFSEHDADNILNVPIAIDPPGRTSRTSLSIDASSISRLHLELFCSGVSYFNDLVCEGCLTNLFGELSSGRCNGHQPGVEISFAGVEANSSGADRLNACIFSGQTISISLVGVAGT